MDAKDSKDPVQTTIELEYEKRSRKTVIVLIVTGLLLFSASLVFRILPDIDLWWELAVVATILIGAGRLVYLIKKGRDVDAKDSKDPVQTIIELEVEKRLGKVLILMIAVAILATAVTLVFTFLLNAGFWWTFVVVLVFVFGMARFFYLTEKGRL